MDGLEDTSVTVTLAPAAPSGYTCTPPIPQGELTTSGTLMISSGLDTSDEGEYRCTSDDVNGTIIIYLDVVGMYEWLDNMYYITTSVCDLKLTSILYNSSTSVSPIASAYTTSSSGDVTADAGSDITLTVTASGDPSGITYIWKKNGVIIPGETSNTLSLNDVSGDDIGQYECIPSNSVGSHNSSIIQVDVNCEFYVQIAMINGLSSFILPM